MRKEEIIEIIGEPRWDEFKGWIQGQTTLVYPDGEPNYFTTDVERFVDGRPIID